MGHKPLTVADIMTTDIVTATESDSIAAARDLMSHKQIRHLPVLNNQGQLIGVVTQKAMLAEIIRLTDTFGLTGMQRQSSKRSIKDVLGADVETIQPQLPILEAARFFLHAKFGCLPVIEDGCLVGILTSTDFVRLSVQLLEA